MANITIVKLKVRRGSDEQRKQITLDQGEVGYTLDTRRLFVGDGSTLGGRVIGNTSVGPFSNIANLGPANSPGLQVGDIGYSNNKLYRLTSFSYDDALSGYAYIGNVPDEGHTLPLMPDLLHRERYTQMRYIRRVVYLVETGKVVIL